MKQVTRSLLTLGILAGAGAAIGGYAWIKAGEAEVQAVPDDKRVFDIPPSRFDRIELKDQGHVVRLEGTGGSWVVTEPARISADPGVVKELLTQAVRIRAEQRLGKPGAPEVPSDAAMGLDARAATFVAWREGEPKTRIVIALGQQSGFNKRLYARVQQADDEPEVVMVPASSKSQLVRPATQLYDRRVLGAGHERVRRLVVEPKEPSPERIAFTLERSKGEGDKPLLGSRARFRVVEPALGEADSFQVSELLKVFSATPVSNFVTFEHGGDFAQYGLEPAEFLITATVALDGPGGEERLVERRIRVGGVREDEGAAASTVYVAREDQPWVGEVNAALFFALPQTVDRLKSKRLIDVDRDEVRRIEMRLKEAGNITLERTEPSGGGAPGWRLLAPEPGPAKVYVVNRFLLTFTRLVGLSREAEGAAVKDPEVLKRTGLDDAQAQVLTFYGAGEAPLGSLRIGTTDGDDLFAMADGGEFIVRVPKAKLREIPLSASELLE